MVEKKTNPPIDAIVDLAKKASQVRLLGTSEKQVPNLAVVPDGMEIHDLETLTAPYRDSPRRAGGKVVMTHLESFIEHTRRYGTANSVIFADEKNRVFESVLNYHKLPTDFIEIRALDPYKEMVTPDWCDWTSELELRLSHTWKAFMDVTGRKLTKTELLAFLASMFRPTLSNERVDDIRGLSDVEGGSFLPEFNCVELGFGTKCHGRESLIEVFKQIRSGTGENKLPISLFASAFPIFEGAGEFQVYFNLIKKGGKSPGYVVEVFNEDLLETKAFRQACESIQDITGVKLFTGTRKA